MRLVEEDSGVAMGPGTIYGSLSRLVDAGWVDEGAAAAEGDARRGKAFSLTPAGRTALTAEASRITRLAGMDRVRELAPERAS
jgi:DNA-binding PadR family transcriptional regulator